ncbi:uncharacterized protein LOC118200341 [Stegodyphus dumicola]|uniref:uncharacterized protein LOC118200341 n=1 Tax=Stegodyphus dumicola TaxID=202533 RepID=UPI0015B1D77C|nr:uncharacterized protein LOC118200341 [Stegodyphus dumicola]
MTTQNTRHEQGDAAFRFATWFQQDGASSHYTLDLRLHLNTPYPTSALQVIAGLPPLDLVVEREAAVVKATRLNKNTSLWGQSIIHTDYEKYKSRYLCHPAQFDLMDTIHINSDSPEQNDHALYTDGSKTEAGTGCGFCELDKGSIIFSWKGKLNESNSVFQAEFIALHAAIIHSRRNGLNQVRIYTDTASSLQAFSSMHSRSPVFNKIQRTLLSIPIPFRPVLCWVPAHVGILGNESADVVAKEAANSVSLLECPTILPTSLLKHSPRKLLIRQWQTRWTDATTGRHTHAMLPSVSMDLQSKTGSMSHFLNRTWTVQSLSA